MRSLFLIEVGVSTISVLRSELCRGLRRMKNLEAPEFERFRDASANVSKSGQGEMQKVEIANGNKWKCWKWRGFSDEIRGNLVPGIP
jgi:hypothetical protein